MSHIWMSHHAINHLSWRYGFNQLLCNYVGFFFNCAGFFCDKVGLFNVSFHHLSSGYGFCQLFCNEVGLFSSCAGLFWKRVGLFYNIVSITSRQGTASVCPSCSPENVNLKRHHCYLIFSKAWHLCSHFGSSSLVWCRALASLLLPSSVCSRSLCRALCLSPCIYFSFSLCLSLSLTLSLSLPPSLSPIASPPLSPSLSLTHTLSFSLSPPPSPCPLSIRRAAIEWSGARGYARTHCCKREPAQGVCAGCMHIWDIYRMYIYTAYEYTYGICVRGMYVWGGYS